MNKFVMNKLGIVDFWFYDFQEFDLADGRLLLRGSNGSGKSVTMQSFIPLLLDGNKTPSRLDPSGSNDKRLENYMLDENRDERTSYLYIEFKNGDSYITIGMGLKAEKNKAMDSWYFILNDGRRINIDLQLYEESQGKIALTKQKLQNRILPTGFFTVRQGEYMRKVNELIFGYDNPENYEELLDLLIQVRAPKISKDFKPAALYEILKDSLKVLGDEDLRTISESMQNMDDLRRRQRILKDSVKSAKAIDNSYNAYNKKILLTKAQNLKNSILTQEKFQKEKLDNESEAIRKTTQIKEIQKDLNETKQSLEYANERLRDYRNSDIYKVIEESERIKNEIRALHSDIEHNESQIIKQNSALEKTDREKNQKSEEISALKKKTDLLICDANDLADSSAFPHWTNVNVEHLQDMYKDNSIGFYVNSIKDHEIRLRKAIEAIEKRDKLLFALQEIQNDEAEKTDEKLRIERDIERMDLILEECKEEWKQAFDKWNDNNAIFKIPKDKKMSVFAEISKISDNKDFIRIDEEIHNAYLIFEQKLNLELAQAQSFEDTALEALTKIREEIKALINTKELEPERSESNLNYRKKLTSANIEWIPFYKAFDFADNLPNEIRNRLESAFYEMGIIDALLIDSSKREQAEKMLEGESDKVIFCEINNISNLFAEYFKTEKETPFNSEILESIINNFFEESSISFVEKSGKYHHGIITGRGESDYIARYIGENSRNQYRMQKISELREMEKEKNKFYESAKSNTIMISENISLLSKEKEEIPNTNDLKTAVNEIIYMRLSLIPIENYLLKLRESLYKTEAELEKSKISITELCKDIRIARNLKPYKEALSDLFLLKDLFFDIKSNIVQLSSKEEYIRIIIDNIENYTQILDDLRYRKNQMNKKLSEFENILASKEAYIKENKSSALQSEINECILITNNAPGKIEALACDEAVLNEQIRLSFEINSNLEEKIKSAEIISNSAKNDFIAEANYNFVIPFEEHENFYKKIISAFEKDCPHDISNYLAGLLNSINANTAELREYNLKTTGSDFFENNAVLDRYFLTCDLNGKTTSFLHLLPFLNNEFAEIDLMIKENEREIFEKTLLNTVSNKIRSKVTLSKLWVKKINSIMSAKSGPQRMELRLKWEGKKAENEDELDIKAVMEILEDDKRVKSEDIEKLSKHFGSKIKNKIRETEDKGEHPNYQAIVKEVLDYRQWYEFKLFANKDNEGMKELTQKNFNQLSVGERAMAMYIPLFAAVNARYDSADKKCPRIVCMDEAFAGISDNNKRILFKLLKDMELEYILNSQELWGTYEEVESLSIYELLREPSDRFVSIIKFYWDGVRKYVGL